MITRILPPEEWGRLVDTPLESSWQDLNPSWAKVLVVEDGDRIVGCWTLLSIWHLEGLWIAPDYRQKTSVARRIWVGMKRLMGSVGAGAAVTAAITPDIESLLDGRSRALLGPEGERLSWYVLEMGEIVCRPSLSLH